MKLITIVTDIGGPVALHDILSELPHNFPIPVLVMQSTSEIIQDSTMATLRRTTALRIVELSRATILHPGVVYFAEADKSYLPVSGRTGLTLDINGKANGNSFLSESLSGLAQHLGEELTVVFLSGRGNVEEISRVCSMLETCHAPILVLSHLESVVDELGRSALRSATSASELTTQQIVDFLLNGTISSVNLGKSTQKAAKR